MKAIKTPITLTEELNLGDYVNSIYTIVDLAKEKLNSNKNLPYYTYVDSYCMVTIDREDLNQPNASEILKLDLANQIAQFDNSLEQRKFYTPNAFKYFVLTEDIGTTYSEKILPAGTTVFCVGALRHTTYQTTDTKSKLILTNGKDTVFATAKQIKTTWKTCKINPEELFDEKTCQYVYLKEHRPALISKAPIYASRKMYCVGKTYLNNHTYYILSDFTDAVLCTGTDFADIEEVKLVFAKS